MNATIHTSSRQRTLIHNTSNTTTEALQSTSKIDDCRVVDDQCHSGSGRKYGSKGGTCPFPASCHDQSNVLQVSRMVVKGAKGGQGRSAVCVVFTTARAR